MTTTQLEDFIQKNDKYIPDNSSEDGWGGLRYDYGNFYASKSFFDPSKNRRVLWGWANESDSSVNDVAKGWAGIQVVHIYSKFFRYYKVVFILFLRL